MKKSKTISQSARKFLMSLIFIIACSVTICQLWAQPKQIVAKEQKKLLEKADNAYKEYKYTIALGFYEKYLSSVPNPSTSLLTKLADCYWQTRQYNNAFRSYKNLYRDVNQNASKQLKLRIGELYARFHEYKKASQWLSGIEGYKSKVSGFMDTLALKSMLKDSLKWNLGFLNLNTPFREFSPTLVEDTLYFSSNRPDPVYAKSHKKDSVYFDRLWKVSKSEININSLKVQTSILKGKFNVHGTADGKGASLVKRLEKLKYNIGTVSIDKNNHFYFTANYSNSDRKGINRLRLIEAFFNNKGSLKMKELPFGDPRVFSVMHSAINMDGTFMVMSSDKPGGKGKFDLYYTQRKSILMPWDHLKAFGKNINTVGNEVFPTLTSNGYLFYSSDALSGLGGLDIYKITLKDALNGKENVEHLSYPVNSSGDDFGWTQDSTSTNGYFTSDRLNNDDIYSFHYVNEQKMSNISGSVLNLNTKEPISDASVFILNKETKKVSIAKTDNKGKYNLIVASTDTVILKAVKTGLTNDILVNKSNVTMQEKDTVLKSMHNLLLEKRTENFKDHVISTNGKSDSVKSGVVMQNLLLNKHILLINANWKLNNIYYNFNRWNIRADAEPVLDSLVRLLKMYPIRVELSSHTDSRGTFEYNDWLSQKRAESVVNYLVKHGVNKYRVKAIGYGKRFLLNKCAEGVPCSESEHRVNRRTEVKVISNPDIQKYQIDAIDPNQFKNGEQINQSALPANFFDNYDKFNSDEESISSFENNQGSDLNSKHKFSIQFARGEFIIESRYQYIVDEMINILFKDPTIIIQITAQDDANDHSPILSGRRANSIRDYFISKGISTGRCLINETRKTKSMVSYGRAVISSNNANLEELVLMNLMQSYKGDTKGIIIKNDNGNYCVQIGEFKTRAGSQDLVAKIQSIISARLFVIEENSIFKIRTKSSRNKNDAIEMAAIIQASGILYGE